jgi:long-chain acyl-CoA synthetase
MALTQGLHRALQQHPHTIATICGEKQQTFEQLADRVARLAGALRSLGVKAGDRVAILAMNGDRYAECYLGLWWINAVANPVNTRWSVPEIV